MTAERELLDRALTALCCALAHDEASQSGADAETLAELRGHWQPEAVAVTDVAYRCGLFDLEDDDENH